MYCLNKDDLRIILLIIFTAVFIVLLSVATTRADTVILSNGSRVEGNILGVYTNPVDGENTIELDVVINGELIGAIMTLSRKDLADKDSIILNNQYKDLKRLDITEEARAQDLRNTLDRKDKINKIGNLEILANRRRIEYEKKRAKKHDERDWQLRLIKEQRDHELDLIEKKPNAEVKITVGDEPIVEVQNNTKSNKSNSLIIDVGD